MAALYEIRFLRSSSASQKPPFPLGVVAAENLVAHGTEFLNLPLGQRCRQDGGLCVGGCSSVGRAQVAAGVLTPVSGVVIKLVAICTTLMGHVKGKG